jgi:hypothetical protein
MFRLRGHGGILVQFLPRACHVGSAAIVSARDLALTLFLLGLPLPLTRS